jgi:MerR family mercuric resistance operon transcriptional regulator
MTAITKPRPGLTIGAISRAAGVNIETIRYYERVGVLPAPPRTASGRRAYGEQEKRILTFIRRGRELGFSLSEIRALLALGAPGDASCAEVREIASLHLAAVRSKIADLARLESLLAEAVARCTGDAAPACPVLDILSQDD